MKKMYKCADGGKVAKAAAKGTPFTKGAAKGDHPSKPTRMDRVNDGQFTSASKAKKMADGGMYESPKMMKDEVKFMKKGGAPKSMVKAEMKEHANMKKMKK